MEKRKKDATIFMHSWNWSMQIAVLLAIGFTTYRRLMKKKHRNDVQLSCGTRIHRQAIFMLFFPSTLFPMDTSKTSLIDVEGNRVDGNFTTTAYNNIVKELKQKIGDSIDKDKVKNRMKSIKLNFNESYDIFKGGLSGFAWNSTTRLWSAEEEVWAALIKENAKAAKWKTTPIGNYYKLCELFGQDRATGEVYCICSECWD